MVSGFEVLDGLKTQSNLPIAELFVHVFKSPFKSSTYGESYKAWKSTPKSVIATAVLHGRTAGGEWAPLLKLYGRSRHSKIQ